MTGDVLGHLAVLIVGVAALVVLRWGRRPGRTR